VRIAADDAFGLAGIDVRVVEQAHLEFPEEHRGDEMQIAVGIGQLDIGPRVDGKRTGFLFVFSDERISFSCVDSRELCRRRRIALGLLPI